MADCQRVVKWTRILNIRNLIDRETSCLSHRERVSLRELWFTALIRTQLMRIMYDLVDWRKLSTIDSIRKYVGIIIHLLYLAPRAYLIYVSRQCDLDGQCSYGLKSQSAKGRACEQEHAVEGVLLKAPQKFTVLDLYFWKLCVPRSKLRYRATTWLTIEDPNYSQIARLNYYKSIVAFIRMIVHTHSCNYLLL